MTHSHAMQQRARMLARIDGREPCYFCQAGDSWRDR